MDGRSENGVAAELTPMVALGADADGDEEVPPELPPKGARGPRIVRSVPPDRTSKEVRLPTRINAVTRKGAWAQCIIAIAVLLLAAGAGGPIGFSSVLLPQLQSPNSTIFTDDDAASWIASVHAAATPVGTILSGPLMERVGRNMAIQLTSPLLAIGWILLALSDGIPMLIAGRVICGMAVGFMGAPSQVFLGEISEPRLRGVLIGLPFVAYALGILLVFLLGATLTWRTVCWISMVPAVLAVIMLRFLPESPVWLVRKGRVNQAQKALDWLRGGAGSVQSKVEMDQLVARAEAEKLARKTESGKKISTWKVWTASKVVKPLFIMNAFNITQIIAGTYMVIFYAVDLVGGVLPPSMDAQLVAVLTGAVRALVSLVGCVLILKFGRRPLAISSAVLTTIAATAVGCTLLFDWSDAGGYLPSTLLLVYVGVNTYGMFLLPGMMMGELLPSNVRGMGGAITFSLFNVCAFVYTKLYPFLKKTLGAEGIFFLFAVASLLNAIITFLFLPETAGRSLSDIEDYFTVNKHWLWHRRQRRRPTMGSA